MVMDGIKNYALYGEDEEAGHEDVLHCETLRSRSVVHDWHIRPHRHHGMHQFFWIASGGGVATIDGAEHRLGPSTAISMPAMAVHGFVFRPGIEGWVITIPAVNLDRVLANSDIVTARLHAPVIFTAEHSPQPLFAEIACEYARFSPERDQALSSLAGLLAVWFAREIAASPGFAASAPDRGQALVMRFIREIEATLHHHRPVAVFASGMGVTPTHLSRVCRRIVGRSASALIHDRLALEARRQLTYTPQPISEIAYALGFQDPAHFSKFFRTQTGQSPSAFRVSALMRMMQP
jgi:AraC family transcriptional regulator, transcriptional activator of pobA